MSLANNSILSSMVNATMEAKTKTSTAKTVLTPTPQEREDKIENHPVLGTIADDPDVMIQRLTSARREIISILESVDRLIEMWGQPLAALERIVEREEALIQKEKERRADDAAKAAEGDKKAKERVESEVPIEEVEAQVAEIVTKKRAVIEIVPKSMTEVEKFKASFDQAAEDAQSQVFQTEATVVEQPEEDVWLCPKHQQSVEKTSVRRGVKYRACPVAGCGKIEKV
jgi:hypothetical protein